MKVMDSRRMSDGSESSEDDRGETATGWRRRAKASASDESREGRKVFRSRNARACNE